MADLPRISLVVPSFNQGRWLEAALDSAQSQGYPALEVIVMDGGSTDGSADILRRRAPDLAHWQSAPDGGQAAAINAGMARAGGDVLGWLNSDDLLCPGALHLIGRAAAAHPDCALFIGRGRVLDEASGRLRPFSPHPPALRREALRHGVDYLLQPATFFSRQAWSAVGGLDPALRWCLDWDLFIRLAAQGPAVLIDGDIGISREHPATKTATGGLGRLEEIRALGRRHAGRDMTPGAVVAWLDEMLRADADEGMDPATIHHLMLARIAAGRALHRLAGRSSGFPVSSDPGDRQFPAAFPPSRAEAPRRGIAYRLLAAMAALAAAAGLRDERWLARRLRSGWRNG